MTFEPLANCQDYSKQIARVLGQEFLGHTFFLIGNVQFLVIVAQIQLSALGTLATGRKNYKKISDCTAVLCAQWLDDP